MTGRTRRVLAAVIAALLVVACVPPRNLEPLNWDRALLDRSWAAYRSRFVTSDGRLIRPENDGDTVSEGQAYAMLRAVWMDDRATFDQVWRWTRDHLARTDRPRPSLMAWHWGTVGGGHIIDWNSATDADSDLALALILANDQWAPRRASEGSEYLAAALAILSDLIELTAVDDAGTRVILAGEWADHRADGRGIVLNPSYLAPASYRVFARVTGDSRWLDVARGSYVVLDIVCRADARSQSIPDWIRWTSPTTWTPEGERQSGWDAIRIPWRVATDALWFKSEDAERLLSSCLTPMAQDRLARAEHNDVAVAGARDDVHPVRFDDDLADARNPLANAMWAFALTRPDERDRLLARVHARGSDAVSFGDADRYYVNSLAYLPFLARAGRYRAPAVR